MHTDPTRPADDEARALARKIFSAARHGALAYAESATGRPGIGRIALATAPDGVPLTLVSDLAQHSIGLRTQADCALMVGEPGDRGDPLTHPRLMIAARAVFVDRDSADHRMLRLHWLARHPKAKLYVDFADFRFVRLEPVSALLNAGFGRAFRLTAEDLRPPQAGP
jgi:putative heme iron utilization protein